MPKTPDTINLTKERPIGGKNYQVYDIKEQCLVSHPLLGLDDNNCPFPPEDIIDARLVVAAAMAIGEPRGRYMILWDDPA